MGKARKTYEPYIRHQLEHMNITQEQKDNLLEMLVSDDEETFELALHVYKEYKKQ